jgi:hypothetical protein
MNKKLASKLCVLAMFFGALIPANASAYGQKWDVGRDWTLQNGPGSTTTSAGVATSDDGRIVYSVGNEVYPNTQNGVRFSDDFGATWSLRDAGVTGGGWSDVTTSSDGSIVAFTQNGGAIWVSRDFGITWEKKTNVTSYCWNNALGPGLGQWLNISMSATGKYIVLAECGKLFRSDDFGATFTMSSIGTYTEANSDMIPTISISSDGQRIVIPNGYLNKLYISYNSGASFSVASALPNRAWVTAAISGDGKTIVAGPQGANLWFSRDSGATWQESALDLDPRYKSWGGSVVSEDGTYMAVTRYGFKIITSDTGGASWQVRPNSPDNYWNSVASTSDGKILYAGAHLHQGSGGVYKSLPTYIYTDYGDVTLLLLDCAQDTSTVTSVKAASVILISDTASAASQGDGSTYKYYSETNTALWGADYTYGSTQNPTTCGYAYLNGTVTLSRGRFMASNNPGTLSESSSDVNEFLQYIGNTETASAYSGTACGNMGVTHAANVTTSCTTAIQADYSLLTHTTPVQVRTSNVKTGVLGQPSGKIYTFVKVLKSVIATAPVGTSWVATETFTVTTS